MSRWFRFYDDTLNDPKVQRLPGDLFKSWVNLLCLASNSDGEIKSLADAAFALRLPEAKAAVIVASLAAKGLLDSVEGGYFAPHNWNGRQYKSDVTDPTAADRMQRYRNRKRNADRNDTVTDTPLRTDTEQITETDKNSCGSFLKVGEVKASGPRHGAVSPNRGTVFIRKGTDDWAAYVADYRKAFGVEPEPNKDGGFWFKIVGVSPLPEPKRLSRESH
jgi:hypothetical protein